MRYLRKIYDYASDGNYVAPGKPWDATPRVVLPSDAQLKAGATPDTAVAAEYENGRNKIISDAQAVQLHAALQSWSKTPITIVGTDVYRFITGTRPSRGYGVNGETMQQIHAFGHDAANSNRIRYAKMADGSSCEPAPPSPAASASPTPVYGIGAAVGEVLVINNGAAISRGLNGTWTTGALTGSPTVLGIHYSPTLGYFALAGSSVSRGVSFAAMLAATSVTTNTPAGQPFTPDYVSFADNGSAILVCGLTTANTPYVAVSTNSGASWSASLTGSVGSAETWNVVWSDYYQLFFLRTSAGSLYASSNGASGSWGLVRAGLNGASGFTSAGRGTFLAVGAALINRTSYTSSGTLNGIAYSLDQGLTWRYHYFLESSGTVGDWPLYAANGRVYFLGNTGTGLDQAVYRSGILGAPISEI